MGAFDHVEYGLSKLLYNFRGRDEKLFHKTKPFAKFPQSTIEITSPDCGPSGSTMADHHTGFGEDRFPELEWQKVAEAQQYILVVEDADIPLPFTPTHGLYHSIPGHITNIGAKDVQLVSGSQGEKQKELKGPLKLGRNITGTIYAGPKPLLGHGPHRYFYQLVALREPLDDTKFSALPSKAELCKAIDGKVVGWGFWQGVYERKWE